MQILDGVVARHQINDIKRGDCCRTINGNIRGVIAIDVAIDYGLPAQEEGPQCIGERNGTAIEARGKAFSGSRQLFRSAL